jgi:hypothetical protein
MWTSKSETLAGRRGLKIEINLGNSPMTYQVALDNWQNNASFREYFSRLLAEIPYSAFRWETPAVTIETADRPFECVLLDDPHLDRDVDAEAFSEHFNNAAPSDIVEFANLGNDAILIVPCPAGDVEAYGHLAAFVRDAPQSQKQELWRTVGSAMQRRLGQRPVWLSTAGAGVAWLHVRLDDRPKYYGYREYCRA